MRVDIDTRNDVNMADLRCKCVTNEFPVCCTSKIHVLASVADQPSSGFPTRFNANQPVLSEKKARNFGYKWKRHCTIHCSKNKGADQLLHI